MEQERVSVEFLPGFSFLQGTEVGSTFENYSYHLEYTGARYNNRRTLVSRGFETCYDWTNVANILLRSLEHFEDVKTFETLTQEYLRSWFMTYPGWGLLSSLLPKKLQRRYIKSLRSVKRRWSMNFEEECTDEKCWNLVLQHSFKDILPKCEIKVMGINDLDFDFSMSGRRKWISVIFSNQWKLEINFAVEKKSSEVTLVNLASKTVAKCFKNSESVDIVNALEIPFTLKTPVIHELKDVKWTACKDLPDGLSEGL